MEPKSDRTSFDWRNYVAALTSGALIAAAAGAATFAIVGAITAPIPLAEFTPIALLGFFLKKIATTAFTFLLLFFPGLLISFLATLVFGSGVLLTVRGTKFQSARTFAAAGFMFGFMMFFAWIYAGKKLNLGGFIFAITGGVAGLAGGYAFGHRICHPTSTSFDFHNTPRETFLTRIARFFLVR